MHHWVSCAINKQGFLRLHLCRHTFASLWGACLRFASLWRTNSGCDSCVLGVHLSKFTEVCFSVFVKRSSFESLLNLRTYSKSLLKVYYRSMFAESSKAFIFQKLQRPLCRKVNLPSCVARRPLCHKVNLPSCVARGPLCPRVNSTEMWSSGEPFHHDLWYFQHRTNEHFRSMLFLRKNT